MTKQRGNEKFIRIKLSNIRFIDPYEQEKFEKMKIESSDKVIEEIESLFEQKIFEVSFD